jgi:putative MATE family efflux protein
LSLPSIASMVTISLYNLVNTFWVARLGHEAMAALTVVMPFLFLCYAIGVGSGIGINALASRRFGERDVEGANAVVGQMFFISLVLGALFLLLTNVFPREILRLAGATPDVMELGVQYIRVLGWGMPVLFFNLTTRNVFQASGDAVRPMIFTLISQICNVVLDPFLIFGWWIFPEMGVSGAALATIISMGIYTMLALWFILIRKKTAYQLKFRHCIPRIRSILAIYRVGFPSMLMEVTESIVFALFNHVIAGFGSVALAAIGIAIRISDLAFMPMIGLAHGLLPIVGFSLGAKLWRRLWGSVRLACIWIVALMTLATLVLEIFTPQVVALFNADPELMAVAVPGLRIFCSTLILIGPTIIFITTFQGLSKARDAMVLSLIRQFIFFIPGLFILSDLMGLKGVWLAMPISDVLGCLGSSLWVYREYRLQRRKNDWEEAPAAEKAVVAAD